MDNFGDVRIAFNAKELYEQGAEDIWYEPGYFEMNPKVAYYVLGYSTKEDFEDDDWESYISTFEHEVIMTKIKFTSDLIEYVQINSKIPEKYKNILLKNNIKIV